MTARGGTDEDAGDGPEAAQEGAKDEVRGIDEEHVSDSRVGVVESRLELSIPEVALGGDVFGQRLFGGRGTARDRCQVKPREARKVRV